MHNFQNSRCFFNEGQFYNFIEVKFMWQISGPHATVAQLGNYILGYLHDMNFYFLINFQFKSKFEGESNL